MFYLILFILLSLLTGTAKAIKDTLSLQVLFENSALTRWRSSWFDSKETTWGRKWRAGKRENGEAFPLSSTVLVFLTDAWHMAQFAVSFLGTLSVGFGVLHFAGHESVFSTLFWTAAGFWTIRGICFEVILKIIQK